MIPYGESGRGVGVLGSRVALGVAVDRRRRGEDDAHAGGGGRFEQALAREHVLAHVDGEDAAEARDARLTGEVEDAVEAVELERVLCEIERATPEDRARSPPSAQGRSSP